MNLGKKLLEDHGIKDFGRILLVKQDVHNDLYYKISPSSADEIIYSSILRSGPVALFSALGADFAVAKVDPAPECNSWQQKSEHCMHNPISYYNKFQRKVERYGLTFDHSKVSTFVDDIAWGNYDIVISIDIAIPSRIIKKHKDICWAYYISEPCMPLYKESLRSPQFEYDLFFTLGFQKNKPAYISDRVLEFPYFLQYAGCFSDLDGCTNPPFSSRHIVSTERHSFLTWTEDQIRAVRSIAGEPKKDFGVLRSLVEAMRTSKFHLRTDGKAIWGNSLVEAAALGALVIASPKLLKHRFAVPELQPNTFEEMLEIMEFLQKDSEFRARCISNQEKMLNDLCFLRPLQDLDDALNKLGKRYR